MRCGIAIRFNLWQRLRVLLGQRVFVMTENDPGKNESYVAWPVNGWMNDGMTQRLGK